MRDADNHDIEELDHRPGGNDSSGHFVVQDSHEEHPVPHSRVNQNTSEDDEYLQIPTQEETKNCFRYFRKATSNESLMMHVCFVCGREMMETECECLMLYLV